MTSLAAVHTELPAHRYTQPELTEFLIGLQPAESRPALVRRFHTSSSVLTRHLALPLERYAALADFGESNAAFIEVGVELGSAAVLGALARAGLSPEDVDIVFSTTVTGLAVPSLEARIASRIGLRADVKRVPMFGLGCVAGAAGIARVHDYLRGAPGEVAVLLSVELCSLTVQRGDVSVANMVASGLFGDGAAAVVAVGADRAGSLESARTAPTVRGSRSRLFPDSERTMGWDIDQNGFTIVLSADVPVLVEKYLPDEVESFLGQWDLGVEDITRWICHPGGPKVIDAVEQSLGLSASSLDRTRRSLAEIGNLSSASVLHVLAETMAADGDRQVPGAPSQPAVLLAMGPGFCAELVLLDWPVA